MMAPIENSMVAGLDWGNPEGLRDFEPGDPTCPQCHEYIDERDSMMHSGIEFCSESCAYRYLGHKCRCCGEWFYGKPQQDMCEMCHTSCSQCGVEGEMLCVMLTRWANGSTGLTPICKDCLRQSSFSGRLYTFSDGVIE